jgi:SAM-dependent methyltransferase
MRYEFRPVPNCNMCGSDRSDFLGIRLGTSQGLNPKSAEGIGIPVKRCSQCGLIYSDPLPVPEDIADHYGLPPEDYWGAEALSWSPDYFAAQIAAAKRLLPFAPGMTALDIGVGIGKAMRSLDLAGFDSWGIEPSAPFRAKAIELMRIDPERVQLAGIEEAEFDDESFDFITFGAVLEHLYDPKGALDKAMRWLKPGGIIQAEVPSADHLIPKLVNFYFRLRGTTYVTHISPLHAPFHLYEFTPRSFADYEIVEQWNDVCEIYHVPRMLHRPFRWWMARNGSGMQLTVFLRRKQNGAATPAKAEPQA